MMNQFRSLARVCVILLSMVQSARAEVGPWPFVPGEVIVSVPYGLRMESPIGKKMAQVKLPSRIDAVCRGKGLRSASPVGLLRSELPRSERLKKSEFQTCDTVLLRFPEQADVDSICRELEAAGARFAEPNYIGSLCEAPDDPYYPTNQKPIYDLIGMEEAWDVATGSRDVIVAVLDSGIDQIHPDLAPNVYTNPDEIWGDGIDNDGNGYIDDATGYNFVTDTPDVQDYLGHGTRVSGIIGARGNDGTGIAGICWEVTDTGQINRATVSQIEWAIG